MKLHLCFLVGWLFLSCADKKETEAVVAAEKNVGTVQELTTGELSSKIPVLNFSEFESQYLQAKEDNTTYVINFWATWCKPCVKELPYFERINAENDKVKVILVSLDFPENIEKQVLPFIEKHNLKSDVILLDDPDANSWIPKVNADWSGAIPATILLKNKENKFFEKSFTYAELETEIQSI